MNNVIITVIMLTYNREQYLPESVGSVLSQTFSNLELIIIDDGSTDQSEQIIKSFNDSRIRYFKFNHTGWASRLRNFGFSKSGGKFIALIDSDDVWLPEKLQSQLDQMSKREETKFVFTDVIIFKDEQTILKKGLYKNLWKNSFYGKIFDSYVQSKLAIYPSSFIFEKKCLETVNALNELFPWTDNDFFHRLAYHFEGCFLNKPLVRIRKHNSNNSEKPGQETVLEMMHMLKTFHDEKMISTKIFNKMKAHYYYLSGILYMRENEHVQARKAFVNCTRYSPLNIKAWIRSFLSLF